MDGNASEDSFAERSHDFVVLLDLGAYEAAESSAVFLADDDVVGNIDKTTCQITGVGCLQGGVGKTLAGTVGRDEVLEH